MIKDQPLISVIVPCYNQGTFLDETLRSVYNQSYAEWECVVINDGSTDNTESVAAAWAGRDRRFTSIFKTNGGLSSARNRGLEMATGEYIQFLDADDQLAPDKFSASMKAAGEADIIMSAFQLFDGKKNSFMLPPFSLTPEHFSLLRILTGWDTEFYFPPHSGIFRRRLFNNKRFDENLRAREDWVMWVALYLENPVTVFINEPYAWYRTAYNSMSQDMSLMNRSLVQAFQVVYEKLPPQYRALFFKQATGRLGAMLEAAEDLVKKTRASKSYRLGNFFVRKFKR